MTMLTDHERLEEGWATATPSFLDDDPDSGRFFAGLFLALALALPAWLVIAAAAITAYRLLT
jgi:hypothetical protein